jgi:hypothetical protein
MNGHIISYIVNSGYKWKWKAEVRALKRACEEQLPVFGIFAAQYLLSVRVGRLLENRLITGLEYQMEEVSDAKKKIIPEIKLEPVGWDEEAAKIQCDSDSYKNLRSSAGWVRTAKL